jgi:hypothetical protein
MPTTLPPRAVPRSESPLIALTSIIGVLTMSALVVALTFKADIAYPIATDTPFSYDAPPPQAPLQATFR